MSPPPAGAGQSPSTDETAAAAAPAQVGAAAAAQVGAAAAALGLAAIIAAVVWGVFNRNVLHNSAVWLEDTIRLLFVWSTFSAVAAVEIMGRHSTVEIDWPWTRHRLAAPIHGLIVVLKLAFLGLLAFVSYQYVLQQWAFRIPSIGQPVGLFVLPVAISATVMLLWNLRPVLAWVVRTALPAARRSPVMPKRWSTG